VCRSRLRNGVGVEFEFQHNIGEADRDLAVPHDRETDRKFVDSPLEEDGFEPSVPPVKETAVERGGSAANRRRLARPVFK